MASSSLPLPPNKLSRRYNCNTCNLSTLRSRVHLYHQVVQHQENFIVYLCSVCEYASRWRCKILRHHSMAHKELEPLKEQEVICAKADDIRKEFRDSGCDLEKMLPCGSGLRESYYEDNEIDVKAERELSAVVAIVNDQSNSDLLGCNNLESKSQPCDDVSTYKSSPCRDSMEEAKECADINNDGIAYICPQCGHAMSNLVALNEHILSHNEDHREDENCSSFIEPSEPSNYGNDSEDESMLSIDLGCKLQGGSNRKYRCSQCSATFNWHGDLSVHLQNSHGIERGTKKTDSSSLYKCQYCNYQAKYQSELSRHNRLHLGVKPFRCHFCTYNSAWKGDLKRHLEAHHRKQIADEKILNDIMSSYKNNAGTRLVKGDSDDCLSRSADECSQSSFGLQSKPKSHSDEKPLTDSNRSCTVCDFSTTSLKDFEFHLFGHQGMKPFSCSSCQTRFNLSWDAQVHVSNYHSNSSTATVVQNGRRLSRAAIEKNILAFMCGICALRTSSESECLRHFEASHSTENPVVIFLDEDVALNQPLQTTSTSSLPKLQKSANSKHTKNYSGKGVQGNRPFRCSVCGHRSNWKWDINKHIKVAHPDNKDAYTETLEPREADTTIEAYMREVRGKVKEENTETADGYNRPYRCSSCGHRSNWKWDVRKHIRLAHSDFPGVFVETLSNEEAKKTLDEYMSSRKMGPVSDFNGGTSKDSAYGNSPRVDQMRLKRFKCSECGYRSNYRSDIVRHNKRKHDKKADVIILSVDDANSSLEEYAKTFPQKSNSFYKAVPLSSSFGSLAESESDRSNQDSNVDVTDPLGSESFWKCTLCFHISESLDSITSHVRKKHAGQNCYKCKLCSFDSNSKDDVILHLVDFHDQNNLQHVDYLYTSLVMKMDKLISGDENFNSVNGIDFLTNSSFGLSSNTDNIDRSGVCVICNATFSECALLIEHYRTIHAKCDEDVALLSNPKMSLETSESTICPLCPYTTAYPSLLLIHTMLHSGKIPCRYQCRHCSYRATTAMFLANHEALHASKFHSALDSTEPPKKKPKVEVHVRQRVCSDVEKHQMDCVSKSGDHDAKSQYSDDSNGEFVKCKDCPWIGLSKIEYIAHKQGHRVTTSNSRKRLVKCQLCSLHLKDKNQLSRHMKVHKRNYSCRRMRSLTQKQCEKEDVTLLLNSIKTLSMVLEKYSDEAMGGIRNNIKLQLPPELWKLSFLQSALRTDEFRPLSELLVQL